MVQQHRSLLVSVQPGVSGARESGLRSEWALRRAQAGPACTQNPGSSTGSQKAAWRVERGASRTRKDGDNDAVFHRASPQV